MISAVAETQKSFLKSQVGGVYPVLFETEKDGFVGGYTPNYTYVKVKADKSLCGKIIKVKITEVDGESCIGKVE